MEKHQKKKTNSGTARLFHPYVRAGNNPGDWLAQVFCLSQKSSSQEEGVHG